MRVATGGHGRAVTAHAANEELAYQDRYGDKGDAQQVDEHERTAAADADDVGEFPDITQPDSSSDRRQDEYDFR
jgi:hypothetical protein